MVRFLLICEHNAQLLLSSTIAFDIYICVYTRMGVLIFSVAYKAITFQQYRGDPEIYGSFMGIFIVV